jgi:hypothetical protein
MVARLGDLGASQQWLLAGAGRPARVIDAPYRRRVPGAGAAALRCTESGLVPVRRWICAVMCDDEKAGK